MLRYEKTLSNIQEVTARSGRVIAVATEGNKQIRELVEHVIYVPEAPELLAPLIEVVPLQLAGVSHCCTARLRRGSATESGQIRDRRIMW